MSGNRPLKLKAAHLRLDDDAVVLVPVRPEFNQLATVVRLQLLELLENAARAERLQGEVIPLWLYPDGQLGFLADPRLHARLRGLTLPRVVANLNRLLNVPSAPPALLANILTVKELLIATTLVPRPPSRRFARPAASPSSVSPPVPASSATSLASTEGPALPAGASSLPAASFVHAPAPTSSSAPPSFSTTAPPAFSASSTPLVAARPASSPSSAPPMAVSWAPPTSWAPQPSEKHHPPGHAGGDPLPRRDPWAGNSGIRGPGEAAAAVGPPQPEAPSAKHAASGFWPASTPPTPPPFPARSAAGFSSFTDGFSPTAPAALDSRARGKELPMRLVTLLFTDIVGSTELKQRLGEHRAMELLRWHHAVVRDTLATTPSGEEVSTAGDSFFLVFQAPSDAVRFALVLQARLRGGPGQGVLMHDRIGIHAGEVFVTQDASGGRARDYYGLHVDLCARVMSLGYGDQILITRFAAENARAALRDHQLPGVKALRWVNHGHYVLKGVDEPVEVFEVGENGAAPMFSPSPEKRFRS